MQKYVAVLAVVCVLLAGWNLKLSRDLGEVRRVATVALLNADGGLPTQLADLESRMDDVESKNDEQQSFVDEAESNGVLNNDMDSLNASLSDLDDRVSALETRY